MTIASDFAFFILEEGRLFGASLPCARSAAMRRAQGWPQATDGGGKHVLRRFARLGRCLPSVVATDQTFCGLISSPSTADHFGTQLMDRKLPLANCSSTSNAARVPSSLICVLTIVLSSDSNPPSGPPHAIVPACVTFIRYQSP